MTRREKRAAETLRKLKLIDLKEKLYDIVDCFLDYSMGDEQAAKVELSNLKMDPELVRSFCLALEEIVKGRQGIKTFSHVHRACC